MPESAVDLGDEECSVIFVKPDMLAENFDVVDELREKIREAWLEILLNRFTTLSAEKLREHYNHQSHQKWFEWLISDTSEGPVFLMVVRGKNAVARSLGIVWEKTDPKECSVWTLRSKYATDKNNTKFHRTDEPVNAYLEAKRFAPDVADTFFSEWQKNMAA